MRASPRSPQFVGDAPATGGQERQLPDGATLMKKLRHHALALGFTERSDWVEEGHLPARAVRVMRVDYIEHVVTEGISQHRHVVVTNLGVDHMGLVERRSVFRLEILAILRARQ